MEPDTTPKTTPIRVSPHQPTSGPESLDRLPDFEPSAPELTRLAKSVRRPKVYVEDPVEEETRTDLVTLYYNVVMENEVVDDEDTALMLANAVFNKVRYGVGYDPKLEKLISFVLEKTDR